MAKAGRPSVMTDEVIRKIEEVAALDGSVEEMAYYAGINRATLYSYIEDNPIFSDRIKALRERPVLKARQTIAKSLEDPKNAQWYLERKKKSEFSARSEVTGADGKELTTEASDAIKKLAEQLNEITRNNGKTSLGSDGIEADVVDTEIQDKN